MKQGKCLKFIQLAAALLMVSQWMGAAPAQAASVQVNPTIRVGLFYGGSALPGANLLNEVGSGYRFGYFDGSLRFVPLGSTAKTAISMVKDQTVYYGTVGGWAGYYDSISSGIAVGGYHLQLPERYADFQSASAAACRYAGAFPAWIDGAYYVRLGAYLDSASAQNAQAAVPGASVTAPSGTGVSVVETGTGTILFQFDSADGWALAVQPGLDDTVKTRTIFRGNTYYGAFQYRRSGGNLSVSNVLPMEDYVQGVILSEMSASWPLEALKAQAVCARTYSYAKLLDQRHSSDGFDICNTVHCQAYRGIAGMSDASRQAVEATYGQYIWYNGGLTEPVYFSCDGGATEDAGNIWYEDTPYLKGKTDPYEAAVSDKIERYSWSVTYTRQELTDLLNGKGYANSGIVDVQVTKTSPTGNVLAITFTDSAGKSFTKTKEDCRTFLGLRSQRYSISGGSGGYAVNGEGTLPSVSGVYAVDGSGTVSQLPSGQPYVIGGDAAVKQLAPSAASGGDTFPIAGTGWGHHVGMSQWGAYSMAQQGYTYWDILQFYYTGIEVRQP